MTAQETERDIEQWIIQQGIMPTHHPYVWPGSWPDRDLADMARSLPGWRYDSAWIWYESWDPDTPAAVREFNQHNREYRAQIIRTTNAWHPPRTLVVVLPRDAADLLAMMMWLDLGETNGR